MSDLDLAALRKTAEAAEDPLGLMLRNGSSKQRFRRAFDPPTALALLARAEEANTLEGERDSLRERVKVLADDKTEYAACNHYHQCGCSTGDDGHCQYCVQPKEHHKDYLRAEASEAERDRLREQVAEAQATTAAMRDALGALLRVIDEAPNLWAERIGMHQYTVAIRGSVDKARAALAQATP